MIDQSKIIFKPETHQYFTKKGQELVSVSKFISHFKEPFDSTGEIIKRCSIKQGKTVEELRKEWDDEKNSACDRGTSLHSQVEHWIKTGKIDKKKEYADVVEKFTKLKFEGKLHSETIIYSSRLGLAGTVDIIDLYKNNCANLLDLKTNKAIKTKGFFDIEKRRFKMMNPPIEHIMDSNFWHYSIQLSLYSLILEEFGYWVNNLTLLWIHPKNREIIPFPVKNLRSDVLQMIKYYKDNLDW